LSKNIVWDVLRWLSQDRPDVNAAYNITGRHGFNYLLPNSLFDGKQHTLTLYGINVGANGFPPAGGKNPDLGTKTFNCPASTIFKYDCCTVLAKLE
jgi:hypothetical protein